MNFINKKSTIGYIHYCIWILLLFSCAIECICYPQKENLLGCLCFVYGYFLVSKFVATLDNIRSFPLATMGVSFYGFCYFFLPLPITLLENKPLTFQFQVPELTFYNQFLSITVVVVAYKIATSLLYRRNNLLNRFWRIIGYFYSPSEKMIWILAFLGLFAMIFNMLTFRERVENLSESGNSMNIIFNVLSSLSICPLCLYFKSMYGDKKPPITKKYVKYFILIIMALGIASTRRALIFNALTSIGLLYIYRLLYLNKKVFTAKITILFVLGGYLVTGPLADLATAMILNRQLQYRASSGQVLSSIWNLYEDKEMLHNAYQAYLAISDNGGDNSYSWSEYYVDNIFLDRFCNIRVLDATLYNAEVAGISNRRGQEYYKEFWINELPSFVTSSFGLKKTIHGTIVDEMVISNFGEKKYGRGYKVGGETGIGLYIFGYWYYIVAFLTYIVFFYVLSSFTIARYPFLLMPLPVMTNFIKYCFCFLNANGIFTIMEFFTRTNLNSIIIYAVVMFSLRIVIGKK